MMSKYRKRPIVAYYFLVPALSFEDFKICRRPIGYPRVYDKVHFCIKEVFTDILNYLVRNTIKISNSKPYRRYENTANTRSLWGRSKIT